MIILQLLIIGILVIFAGYAVDYQERHDVFQKIMFDKLSRLEAVKIDKLHRTLGNLKERREAMLAEQNNR